MELDFASIVDGTTLPDFSLNPDLNYNAPPSTSGFDWKGALQTGVKTFGDVVSIVDRRNGAPVAQPVTIPAPNSPVGRQDEDPPNTGTFSGFAARMASKFGVAVGMVWAILAGLAIIAAIAVYRFIKR